jgi:hypothetical protein
MASSPDQTRPTVRPAELALSVAGLLEIVISAVLFGLKIYIPAVSFGFAAFFIALVANAIRTQAEQMARRRGEVIPALVSTPQTARLRLIGFIILMVIGLALIAGGVLYLLESQIMAAVTFGSWVLTIAVVAMRLRH